MSLVPGTRLGPYEVVAPLGAGGMGEVFRARDTRLERSVAIKVLPSDFAQNAQLKLRFEREAKAISQLSHPNICTLYDVGDGYLVMELLEGETLADRIAKGPLPLDQVIRIGTEIANALDRAHKAGVVHRDLKPGNVMLTKSGAKLLDFGLAKSGVQVSSPVLSGMTVQKPLTEEGTLLGTFQYMAPEQLEGAEADARTDIFALGSVLYEMTTGKPAFQGKSKASLIASILGAEPAPISSVQPMAPATLDRVVRKCLEKDPDERWQSAHDLATELQWVATASGAQPRAANRSWTPWIAAAAVVALAIGGMLWRDTVAQRNAPVVRTAILPPDKTVFVFSNAGAPPAISPDGTKIVFGAAEQGKTRTLWVRSLDTFAPQQLAGTEGALFPFWSPDGRFIAFFADNALKKIEISGGAPVVLCNVADGRGGSWSPDGQTIVFAGRYTSIFRIGSGGGTAVAVTKPITDRATQRFPEFLPDGRHFLFLASPNGNNDPGNTIYVGAIDGSMQKPLITNALEPHYFSGCILFVRDQILTAQPFDEKRLAVVGDTIALKEQHVDSSQIFSRSIVTVSAGGTLVYEAGAGSVETALGWYDRNGKPLGDIAPPARFNWAVLAPDGKRVAVSYVGSTQSNLWMFDLARNVKTRLTFNPGIDNAPSWSPDGRKIAYTSLNAGTFRILLHDLATGAEGSLLDGPAFGLPMVTGWSADGQRILFQQAGRDTRGDIYWMALADRKPHVYLRTSFIEGGARFSPDGKWVVYQSDETGTNEVYLAPFPPTGAKWQVSSGGGVVPRWRADGKEIFYIVPSVPALMSVPFTSGDPPQIGQPQKLFEFRLGTPGLGMYDVTADGQRFLVNTRAGDDAPPTPLLVVQHFDRELRSALEHRE